MCAVELPSHVYEVRPPTISLGRVSVLEQPTGKGIDVNEPVAAHDGTQMLLHRGELPHAALPRLLGALAGPDRLLVPPDPVLLVNRGVLDVAVQLSEVLRVDDRHRDRRPLPAVLLVHELEHQVVVGARAAGGRIGPPRAEDLGAVTIEDPQLELAGLGQPGEHWHVAPAVRGPVLGDHEDAGRAAGLRGEPRDRLALVGAEAGARVALEDHCAVVLARRCPERAPVVAKALAGQVLGAADVHDVLVEGHAAGEPLRRNDALGHGGSSSGTAVDIRGPSSMKHRASSRVRPIPSTSACALYLRARVTTSTAHSC